MAGPFPGEAREEGEEPARRPVLSGVAGSPPAIASQQRRAEREVGRLTAEAYERHAGEIHGFLLRIVRDPDVAADLTADTFTKLFTEEAANRTPLHPRAWLYRVASNLAMSRGRRVKAALRVSREMELRAPREDAASPEHQFLDRERDAALHQALAEVTVEERTALLLSAAGYPGATIAGVIGKSHVATRTLLFRARRRLRAALEAQDVR